MQKIFGRKSFLIFLILPFLKPISIQYISTLSIVDKIFDIWKIISIGIILFFYIIRLKITKTMILIILLEFTILLSSIINRVDVFKPLTNLLTIVGFSMLVELSIKQGIKNLIDCILMISGPMFLINFLLTICYPNGLTFADLYMNNALNPLYFLTLDNGFSKWILPFLSLIFIRYSNGDRINKFIKSFYWILGLITIIIIDSASSIFIYILFTVSVYIFEKIRGIKIPITSISIGYIVSFIVIIILGWGNRIIGIVTNLLGRSPTLTGRTELWKMSIDIIKKKPILGYGYTSGNIKIWGGYFSSHNQILELLIHGGIITLIILILLMIRTLKKIRKYNSYFINMVFATLFLFFIIFFVETGMNIYLFAFIIFANSYCEDIQYQKIKV